jgi:hypothetical protein
MPVYPPTPLAPTAPTAPAPLDWCAVTVQLGVIQQVSDPSPLDVLHR